MNERVPYGYSGQQQQPQDRMPLLNAGGGRIIEPPRLDPRRQLVGAQRAFQGLAENGDLSANIQGDTDVVGGSLYVPSGNDFAIGAEGAPDAYTLQAFFAHTSFLFPPQGASAFYSTGWIEPSSLGGIFMLSTIFLPIGVTITGAAMRAKRTSGADFARLIVVRVDDAGTPTPLANATQTAIGLATTSVVLSEVTTVQRYALQVEITSAFAAPDTQFHYALITYQKSKLRHSI